MAKKLILLCKHRQGKLLCSLPTRGQSKAQSLFVSALCNLAEVTLFADDNYIFRWHQHLSALIKDKGKSLKMITNWFKQSELKVTGSKTEICLFYHNDQPPVVFTISGTQVASISFNSKPNWQIQGQKDINSSKNPHCLQMFY